MRSRSRSLWRAQLAFSLFSSTPLHEFLLRMVHPRTAGPLACRSLRKRVPLTSAADRHGAFLAPPHSSSAHAISRQHRGHGHSDRRQVEAKRPTVSCWQSAHQPGSAISRCVADGSLNGFALPDVAGPPGPSVAGAIKKPGRWPWSRHPAVAASRGEPPT